jgi:hypothetical protein
LRIKKQETRLIFHEHDDDDDDDDRITGDSTETDYLKVVGNKRQSSSTKPGKISTKNC